MAKVRKVAYNPHEVEVGGNFVDHPAPAVVKVKCVTANLEETFKSGNEGAHLVFDILAKPPAKGKKWAQLHLRYIYSDAAEASWREVEVMEALLGKRSKQYSAAQLTGKTCLAKLRVEEYQGEEKPGIKNLMPLDSDEFEADEEDDDTEPDEEDAEPDEDEDDEDGEDDEDDEDDYNDWSLAQLRAELKRRGLPSSGKKDDLVTALEENDGDDDDDEEPEDEEEETEDYSEWDRAELAAEAKRRGLKVLKRHTEDDLIEMLEADDEDDEDPLDDDE